MTSLILAGISPRHKVVKVGLNIRLVIKTSYAVPPCLSNRIFMLHFHNRPEYLIGYLRDDGVAESFEAIHAVFDSGCDSRDSGPFTVVPLSNKSVQPCG